MNWFLDMNILVYYCTETGDHKEKKAKLFVKKKRKNIFLLCEYIQKENLPKWIDRRMEILRRFNGFVSGQEISEGRIYLFNQDKIFLNKLISGYEKSSIKNDFVNKINEMFLFLKTKLENFLEKYIDRLVIPIKEIDFELQSSLNTYLQNISDAKTIASGIQEHQNNKLILITADKKDWNKSNLEWSILPASDLEKKYPSLPKIEYLQNFS